MERSRDPHGTSCGCSVGASRAHWPAWLPRSRAPQSKAGCRPSSSRPAHRSLAGNRGFLLTQRPYSLRTKSHPLCSDPQSRATRPPASSRAFPGDARFIHLPRGLHSAPSCLSASDCSPSTARSLFSASLGFVSIIPKKAGPSSREGPLAALCPPSVLQACHLVGILYVEARASSPQALGRRPRASRYRSPRRVPRPILTHAWGPRASRAFGPAAWMCARGEFWLLCVVCKALSSSLGLSTPRSVCI